MIGFSLATGEASAAGRDSSTKELPHKSPVKKADDDKSAPVPTARTRKRRVQLHRPLTAAEKHRIRSWNDSLVGPATYYGVHERLNAHTANGEKFDPSLMTAASRTLPLGSYARITCKATGRDVIVRINDRGPFDPKLVMDLSLGAAKAIGLMALGTSEVRIEPIATEAMR